MVRSLDDKLLPIQLAFFQTLVFDVESFLRAYQTVKLLQNFVNQLFKEKVKDHESSKIRVDYFCGNVYLEYNLSDVQINLLRKVRLNNIILNK